MVEHKGFTIVQAPNKHIMIAKNGKMVLHAKCDKMMTDEELKTQIDNYISFKDRVKESEDI